MLLVKHMGPEWRFICNNNTLIIDLNFTASLAYVLSISTCFFMVSIFSLSVIFQNFLLVFYRARRYCRLFWELCWQSCKVLEYSLCLDISFLQQDAFDITSNSFSFVFLDIIFFLYMLDDTLKWSSINDFSFTTTIQADLFLWPINNV